MVLVIATLVCGTANGQVLALSIDLNTPAADGAASWGEEPEEVNSRLAFGLGLYTSSVFSQNSPFRYGVEIGYQELTVRAPSYLVAERHHSALNILGGVDRRIVGGSSLNLSAGMAMGFSFMSNSSFCNEPFCNFPKLVLILTPKVKVAVRVSHKIVAFLDIRGAVFLNDAGSTYPYKSGVVVAIGIENLRSLGGDRAEEF